MRPHTVSSCLLVGPHAARQRCRGAGGSLAGQLRAGGRAVPSRQRAGGWLFPFRAACGALAVPFPGAAGGWRSLCRAACAVLAVPSSLALGASSALGFLHFCQQHFVWSSVVWSAELLEGLSLSLFMFPGAAVNGLFVMTYPFRLFLVFENDVASLCLWCIGPLPSSPFLTSKSLPIDCFAFSLCTQSRRL